MPPESSVVRSADAAVGKTARWSAEGSLAGTQTAVRLAWVRQFAQSGDVLVVGYGDGTVVAALTARDGARVTVLDSRPGVVANAEPELPASVCLRVAPPDEFPFDEGTFDTVVVVPADVSSLERLGRLVRPGGVLLAAVAGSDRSHAEAALNRSFPAVRAARVDVMSASVLWDGRDRPGRVEADVIDGPTGAGGDWYLVAGDVSLPAVTAAAALVGQDAAGELRLAAANLEKELAAAEAEVRSLRSELERLRDAWEQLLRAQVDTAAAIELRFERDILVDELTTMAENNQRALDEIEHLGELVHELRRSTSWKVTAPMRRFSSMVKR